MVSVLKPGFYTSIQDKGRVGFASNGVPVSGVMDSYAADIANSVLNNSLEAALLEITFGGCKLEFLSATAICISGGDFSAKINNQPIALNSRIKIYKNDVLSFGKINFGARCYLAVKGGFLTEKVLGSSSFYQNITNNLTIKKGDILPITTFKNDLETANSAIKIPAIHFNSEELKCYKGPEFELLNHQQQEQLLNNVFTISNDNNRMGYRLNEIIENDFPSILTSAVLVGVVQLTPSGKLIVLMRDCQVTGGYPRILQLTEESINKLAQKTTHQKLKFVLKSI
ncbi:biotin-dependent carboxyltransferase family protein [Polaribacter batillariae]|uniref:Biotin-dependent carboxyltransferase family protein n=1 Tax=Polaribacter batillariae TaxID=2808900 RepID=A0ABX7SXG1_9FLAO|nr:biotin-dependent carboxyltransferase family protein [Polaribacter batillariae]QTD38947.1 biotin-dependent carboxyltransferase family protein [Polaribacter batillariae]